MTYNYMRFFLCITAHGPLWPAYLMRHGPVVDRLVFPNEKACSRTRKQYTVGLNKFKSITLVLQTHTVHLRPSTSTCGQYKVSQTLPHASLERVVFDLTTVAIWRWQHRHLQ